ncbi:RING-H2 finger protein ATL32-like protein, partial [Drosera capensis]
GSESGDDDDGILGEHSLHSVRLHAAHLRQDSAHFSFVEASGLLWSLLPALHSLDWLNCFQFRVDFDFDHRTLSLIIKYELMEKVFHEVTEVFSPDDVLRILPYCGHFFHVNCIDIWLHQHCTCPICRISLLDINEKKHVIQPIFSSRSHFGFDSPALHSHHCLLAAHICTTKPQGNNRVADSYCGTSSLSSGDAEDAGENTPSGERLSGDGTSKPSESKDVESPLS